MHEKDVGVPCKFWSSGSLYSTIHAHLIQRSAPIQSLTAWCYSEMSASHQLRLQGNQILLSATENLAPAVWQSRVTRALAKYQTALQQALTSDDRSSATKNCAVASRKLAIFNERKVIPINRELVLYYYKESIKHFQKAYSEGSGCKSHDWLTDIEKRLSDLVQEIFTYARSEDLGQGRVITLMKILDVLQDDKYRGVCNLEICQTYFKAAITAIDKRNFQTALSCLKECYQPVEDAKMCGKRVQDDRILTEARILEDDMLLQMCTAEAMQAIFVGDDTLNKALQDYENLPMPLVWNVIDWYRSAVMLAREQDVELDAMAHARIGKVYHKVLNMPMIGKREYKYAIDLATSLHPRTFNTTAWYQECAANLADIQKESVLEEEKRKDEARKETMNLIKEELKEIDTHCNSSSDLLRFIYKKFPPKNPRHVLPEKFEDSMKKTLCSAIQHYHPDKIDVKVHGMKWKVLCEEITKRLTNKYETHKGVN